MKKILNALKKLFKRKRKSSFGKSANGESIKKLLNTK
jgi:hypothetical protein